MNGINKVVILMPTTYTGWQWKRLEALADWVNYNIKEGAGVKGRMD